MSKYIPAIMVFAAFLIGSSAVAQPVVSLGNFESDLICGDVSPFGTHIQHIAIANPDAEQKAFTIVFSYSLTNGTCPDPTLVMFNGIDQMFADYGSIDFYVEHRGDTGIAVIQAENIDFVPGGLVVNPDPVDYFGLSFGTLESGSTGLPGVFTIDSTASVSYGDWEFSAGTAPAWGGGASYDLAGPFPSCGATFTDCPTDTIYCSPCAAASYGFRYMPCMTELAGVFDLVAGPGGATIHPLTGVFQFIPSTDQVGQSFDVTVRVGEDWCGDGSYFRWTDYCDIVVSVVDCVPPQFIPNQPHRFAVTTGDQLTVQMSLVDPDPYGLYAFSYYIDTVQDPIPPCSFDTHTGAFTYLGTAVDTAVYYVHVVASEGNVADSIPFTLYHFDSYICGNLDHQGGINVVDLTWLVDYIFNGGIPPVTTQAGDVDCNPGITVSDLTYLVAYIFKGGPEPCAACP